MKTHYFICSFSLFFLLGMVHHQSSAQQLDWVRNASSIYKQGAMITRDNKNNVISCGYTINGSIYTRKWDRFGNFLWERNDTTAIHSNYEQSTWIVTDAFNNIYTLGYRYSFSSYYQFPNALVLLKYNPSGKLIFKKNIDGVFGYTNIISTILRCALDPSGNIFIAAAGTVTGQSESGFNLIKLDPNGNTIFTAVHNFGSVHAVNNMRYRNGYIAITGSTAFYGMNCTTALFDENGNYLWGATTTSRAGQDVEVDNNGNVYVVNLDFASGLDNDMKVTKYSVTGDVLFTYFYDNNSNDESPARINIQPDGNFVITGIRTSNYFPGIQTFKLSSSGSLMWDAFYAQAFPDIAQINFMATNAGTGEIFITGTTSISGNPASIFILKYDSLGNESWVAKYDSTATRGMGLAIASDGSIFSVGLNWWTVLHYLNTNGTGTCSIPANVTVSNINNTGATISWNPVAGALMYHVHYKTATSSLWIQLSTDKPTLTLKDLSQGTAYDVGVEAICNNGATGFSATQQFITSGIPYCSSMGIDPSNDRITFVWMGAIENQTFDINGYSDFTSISTELIRGSSNQIVLSSVINGTYNQTWRVWIDLNHDGDFLDNGELRVAFKSSNTGWNIKTLSIPANALTGPTRMRVSLKKGSPEQTPCETFAKGEVEDYTVNIINYSLINSSIAVNASSVNDYNNKLFIAPNPANNLVTVQHNFNSNPVHVTLYNMLGKTVMNQLLTNNRIDVSNLSNGIYIIQISHDKQILRTKLIIQR